jgi:hypothetical protein
LDSTESHFKCNIFYIFFSFNSWQISDFLLNDSIVYLCLILFQLQIFVNPLQVYNGTYFYEIDVKFITDHFLYFNVSVRRHLM